MLDLNGVWFKMLNVLSDTNMNPCIYWNVFSSNKVSLGINFVSFIA